MYSTNNYYNNNFITTILQMNKLRSSEVQQLAASQS